ncbi:LysR family transcriptional regulator ArgP [Acinetobacter sp. ASP199]|uniref:LysR family transcriptional regulator ArgP n=1 Tax=unclassified Acinetobacter TaxID=196816 RepID=UPI001F607A2B|nr:LysR family transcriptional regulator ArgP [Acinetobacter sp. ASP199]UNT58429.1 LysR family transcriptional regulator ArgP [Acinetobacter sp. ASP199]
MLPHKYCEAFLAVAETGSFEHAALSLCITASAVTLRVQNLEKVLGNTLILRERPCRVTATGQLLLEHLQHQRLMEQNLLQQLQGKSETSSFYKLNIATNADSLATWLLPTLQSILIEERISLQLSIDDQSKTHELMEAGVVNACISSEPINVKGCTSHALGAIRYVMVATPAFKQQWFAHGIHREALRQAPAVIFGAKDQLHSDFILRLFGLNMHSYPYHFIPSSTAFVEAIQLGLGYGMVPEMQILKELETGSLIELMPEATTPVHLYWHHWKQQSEPLKKLTDIILQYTQQHFLHD